MAGQVPEPVKNERSRIIREISTENKRKYRQSMIGKEQTVLVEKYNPDNRLANGYGQHYIPVEFRSVADPHNKFCRVMLSSLGPGPDPPLKGALSSTP
jgi:threonylcarbamoyladenosine tRNA methylthiotransferase MtaB